MTQNETAKQEEGTSWFGGVITLMGIFVVLTWLCF